MVWDDAESDHGWQLDEESDPKEALATTVGFLIKETENHYLVASTISTETDGSSNNNRLQIPKGMVKSCEILKKCSK